MNAAQAVHDKRPVFTHGSLIRHVAVMTSTGAIGLMAVFAVDLLSLFWVSKLGDQAFKAAVGYVGLITFFVMSINIGLTIAASATVSRALGAGDRPRARRLAASSLAITLVFSAAMAAAMIVLRDWILSTVLHAHGESAEVASKFIAISMPANVPLALGITLSGVLRAVGDARRAMYVTLSAGAATAVLDPLLIFGLGLGVYGAAWATVLSRLIMLVVGWSGAAGVHNLVARPKLGAVRGDFGPIMAIGFPAIMANMAAPVSSAYTWRIFSDFGEAAIAAYAVIDRVTPVAFGVIFALSGSIGPIIGQNVGAKLMGRVRRALTDAFILSIGYVLVAWMVLALAAPLLIAAFEARGESADYVAFYCRYGVSAWLFLACLFVANAAFNNLGFPVLAMAFNWTRATLGTIPFVTVGARFWGVKGGLVGFALGAALFGVLAVGTAYFVTWRLAKGFDGADRAGSRRTAAVGGRGLKTRALISWKRVGDIGEGRVEAGAGGADAGYDRERDAGA
ncbi:MAG TPA: MATE family efflux transporter [Roseiarcus sp.]|nr:MATE family efflux transporter [Roseiarcus sp.]